MRRRLSSIILLLLISATGYSQTDSLAMRELEFRVKKIEDYRTIDDKKFEVKSRELDLKVEEYRQQKTIMDYIALTVGGLTIVSLFGLWYKAKAMAEKKIEEKLEKLLEERRQRFINIIESHDKEEKLKKENSILAIASENANTVFLMQFFKNLGFEKVKLKRVTDFEPLDDQLKYDILFLFREAGNEPLNDTIAGEYMKNSRNDAIVFSFGKFMDDTNKTKRMSSATFWSQLYGNLISALKYQQLID